MDFLNKAFAQISDLFRSMTPAARITTGLLLVVVVVSLVYLFDHQMSGPDAFLMGGEPIPASELQAMESAFGKAGLTGYVVEGNRIRVPRGQQAAYMAALADAQALPASFGSYLRKALDGGNAFTTSKNMLDKRMQLGLQDDLSLIIRSMRGVEKASVLFNEQVEPGLSKKKVITAAVSVKALGNQPLEEDRVPAIRHLVASAIGGPPDSVTVIDLNSGQAFVNDSLNGGAPGGDRYAEAKRKHEKAYSDKIRDALSYIPGVVVATEVEIDPTLEQSQLKQEIDPKTVALRSRETSKTSNEQSAAPGGRPGLGAQGGVANASAVLTEAAGSKSDTESTERDDSFVAPTTTTQSKKASLTPMKVAVSVGIPSSYFVKIWQEKNPPAAGEAAKKPDANALASIETEIRTKVEDAVAHLIPRRISEDLKNLINVTQFPSLPSDPIPQPTMSDQVVDWLSVNWSTVGMCVLGLFSLMMLRSMVRSAPVPESAVPTGINMTIASPMTIVEEAPAEELEPGEATPARRKRRLKSGPTLRDDLVEMVREDPDAAANVLRSWIGTTS
jgi:flagellar M-ring protein FliF